MHVSYIGNFTQKKKKTQIGENEPPLAPFSEGKRIDHMINLLMRVVRSSKFPNTPQEYLQLRRDLQLISKFFIHSNSSIYFTKKLPVRERFAMQNPILIFKYPS